MARPSLFAVPLLVVASLTAQTSNHLVGLTRTAGNLRHQSHTACAQLGICAPAGFPSAAGMPPEAGGTAWDAIHGGAWISNGQFLACVDDTCTYLCTPFAVPGLGNSVITGLEVVEKANQLWAIDSNGNLRIFDLLACPPVLISTCAVAFTNPFATTGLAVDELAGLVFYGRVDVAAAINYVTVATTAAPCAPTQLVMLPACAAAIGGLRGLAADAVARVIYGTDGLRTTALAYVLPAPTMIAITGVNCCPGPAAGADPMIGLAVRPGRATTLGVPCAAGGCAACPMNHGLAGDSVLGNNQFALRLDGAPVGSLAWSFLGVGPCWNPGVGVPGLCGLVHIPSLLGTLGAQLVTGGGVCGSTEFALPLPSVAGLGGLVLSSQCLVLCPGGTAMSNCAAFELQAL